MIFALEQNFGLEFLNDKNGTIHNVPSRRATLSCDSSVFVYVLFCFVFLCVCVIYALINKAKGYVQSVST